MKFTTALKWGLYDRLLAGVSFLVGLGLLFGGIWYGAGNTLLALPDVLLGARPFVPPENPTALAAGAVLGVFVWQVGRATVRYHGLARSTSEEVTTEVNTDRLKSEILEVVDGRIADLEAELDTVTTQVADETKRDGSLDSSPDEQESIRK